MSTADLMKRLAAEVDALGGSFRERDLPDDIAGMVERMLGARVVMVFLDRRSKDGLALMASRGVSLVRRSPVIPGDGIVAVAAREGRAIVRRERPDLPPGSPRRWESRLTVAAPIRCGGLVQGVIATGPCAENVDEGPELELLGSIAGLALLNARSAYEQRAARQAADFDALTGLRNKRSFREHLDVAVEESRQTGRPLSLLIFDIDHFKQYNDHHGHPAGDRVLQQIGALVRSGFREGLDVAARFGGEEFVVIFPDTGKQRAFELAERFRREVEEHAFRHAATQPGGKLTVSGGVAAFPVDAMDGARLLEVADQWLYEAKRMSRNRISRADGEAGPRVMEITEHR